MDGVIPEIVDEYDRFFDPKSRSMRLDDATQFERDLKASGEEGLAANSSRRDAKEKFLVQMGYEFEALRKKEEEWIEKVIKPFESFNTGGAFEPVERLLQEYHLLEFLKKPFGLVKEARSQTTPKTDSQQQTGPPTIREYSSHWGI